jgi:hypothetical protein
MPIPTPPAGSESDVKTFTTGVASKDLSATRDLNAPAVICGNSADLSYEVYAVSTPYDPYTTNFVPSRVITASYTVEDSPMIILADATAGNIVITLQPPQFAEGKTVTIQRLDATANTVTLATVAGANVRITTTASAKLNTQYGVVDCTAVNDPTYPIWVGR